MIVRDVQHQALPNIGDVYWQHIPIATSIHFGIVVWIGGFDDPDQKEGLAHLFEHMPFRGTFLAPDKRALSLPIESVGGKLNAQTGLNYTSYVVEVPSEHWEIGWRTLLDLVFSPTLRAEDLRDELSVVEAEIARAENHVSREDLVRLFQAIFGPTLGGKAWILGESHSLRNITKADLDAFHTVAYGLGHIAVIATGDAPVIHDFPATVQRSLENVRLPIRVPKPRLERRMSSYARPDQWETKRVPTRHPRLSIAAPLHEWTDTLADVRCSREQHLAALAFDTLGERSMTSVLFQELRERRGLVYAVNMSSSYLEQNLGMWRLDLSLKRQEDIPVVMQIVRDTMLNITLFTDAEVTTAKSAVLGRLALRATTPKNCFEWIMSSLVDERRILETAEWERRIREATPANIRAFVTHWLHPDRWSCVTYLPS